MRGAAVGRCLSLVGFASIAVSHDAVSIIPTGNSRAPLREDFLTDERRPDHLAVVVPAYEGDLDRAVASLERWPTKCSSLTVENVDLVLYYAEGEEDKVAVEAAAGVIASTAGSCFRNLRIVYAHLKKEEDVYPKGPSVMFYKMFLDEGVRTELSDYDALAIVEWDVLVASDRSFEELYHAAFRVSEEFWVKGSNLEGTNLHASAEMSDMWRVLGHINGNAIYNNKDPAFVEYVDYTRTRWEYKYPYDVALWLTISDFPYSWPLYQRYSSKFVTTNLISYVGYEHVDHDTVSDAVAGQTLFIHGSRVDEGSVSSIAATAAAKRKERAASNAGTTSTQRRRWRWRNLTEKKSKKERSRKNRNSKVAARSLKTQCTAACGSEDVLADLPDGTSTVCDATCGGKGARFDGFLCGAGDSEFFGDLCRLCYVSVDKAREAEMALRSSPGAKNRAVIMCDTMKPPPAKTGAVADYAVCSEGCAQRKDTVCDSSCGTNLYGDYNCDWKGLGLNCRFCFDDLDTALMADEVAKRNGGRVIMCSTLEPPLPAVDARIPFITKRAQTTVSQKAWASGRRHLKSRNSPDSVERRSARRWSTRQVPVEEPRRRKMTEYYADDSECDDGCEYISKDGTKGRVCDPTCEDGNPYGTLGCGAKGGMYGDYCRTCYNDVTKALSHDSPDNRAIMCDTVLPVDIYSVTSSTGTDPDMGVTDDDKPSPTPTPDEPFDCDDDCEYTSNDGTKGRVCDDTCEDGNPYGTLGCGAKGGMYGDYCRTCYNDVTKALSHDSPDNRAIMCDTVLPVDIYSVTSSTGTDPDRGVTDDDKPSPTPTPDEPSDCDDDCEYTSNDGTKGRVCDDTCEDGNPYGTLGCGAKGGMYGDYCRTCYNDVTKALSHDSPDNRAIMCDTVLPVDIYSVTSGTDDELPAGPTADDDDDRVLPDEPSPATDDDDVRVSPDEPSPVTDDDDEPSPVTDDDDDVRVSPDEPSPATVDDDDVRVAPDEPSPVTDDDDDVRVSPDEPSPSPTSDEDLPVFPSNDDEPDSPDEPSDEPSDSPDMPSGYCEEDCEYTSNDGTKGRVCDDTCEDGNPYGTLGCGAKGGLYGDYCRICYNDVTKALSHDSPDNRAIMCDTVLPVDIYSVTSSTGTDPDRGVTDDDKPSPTPTPDEPSNCDDDCEYTSNDGTKGRVCDDTCEDGNPYGTLGCGAKGGMYGDYCRTCYNDVTKALSHDSPDNRAIMCDTVLPVDIYSVTSSTGTDPDMGVTDDDEPSPSPTPDEPSDCYDDCEHTSDDGVMGRVCDPTCEDGNPYGTLGCGAADGLYGEYCRICYYDVEIALGADSPDDRAIMCDTVLPVEVYGRRLSDSTNLLGRAPRTSSGATATTTPVSVADDQAFSAAAKRPFTKDIALGSLCAFVGGRKDEVDEWTVTVKSILQFAPGMRVAVAAEEDGLYLYESTLGGLPGVSVVGVPNARTASLFADSYCGVASTSLIMYVTRGSVFSRPFTSKDTHSPRGDLLVVYSSARASHRDSELAKHTASLLSSEAAALPPSFTYGTDLMLPIGANAQLRDLVVAGDDPVQSIQTLTDLDDLAAVPQVLAALQYSRQPEGVWFLDPQAWVSRHLFKEASIWDIPLVKPRFTCAINPALMRGRKSFDVAEVLRNNLDFFSRGGKCQNGQIDFRPQA